MRSYAGRMSVSPTARPKVPIDGRLVWFDSSPDDHYWERYWGELRAEALEQAAAVPLADTELGRLLQRSLPPGCEVLEAGCGVGTWMAPLVANGYRVQGVERSPDVVAAVARVAPHLAVRTGDVLDLDLPDESVDAYLSLGVAEHFQEGPARVLAEGFRVLRPGGVAVVEVPAFGPVRRAKAKLGLYRRYRHTQQTDDFYPYGFSVVDLRRELEAAGFVFVEAELHGAHRMLLEEVGPYRWLNRQRGQRHVKRLAVALLGGQDGHTLVTVSRKPS